MSSSSSYVAAWVTAQSLLSPAWAPTQIPSSPAPSSPAWVPTQTPASPVPRLPTLSPPSPLATHIFSSPPWIPNQTPASPVSRLHTLSPHSPPVIHIFSSPAWIPNKTPASTVTHPATLSPPSSPVPLGSPIRLPSPPLPVDGAHRSYKPISYSLKKQQIIHRRQAYRRRQQQEQSDLETQLAQARRQRNKKGKQALKAKGPTVKKPALTFNVTDEAPCSPVALRSVPPGIPRVIPHSIQAETGQVRTSLATIRGIARWVEELEIKALEQLGLSPFNYGTVEQQEKLIDVTLPGEFPAHHS